MLPLLDLISNAAYKRVFWGKYHILKIDSVLDSAFKYDKVRRKT